MAAAEITPQCCTAPERAAPIPAAFTLIIALLLLSALGTAAAYTIYIYFYSKHDVGKIAPYLFTVPMLSVVFSHLMLGTAVTRVELLGLAPLAAGIYLTSRRM
jgi:drug/metabolite transporter (DMT)-like permease